MFSHPNRQRHDSARPFCILQNLRSAAVAIVVGDSAVGPWKGPLGKPLVAKGSTPVPARDPSLLQDDGTSYLGYGVWDYYVGKSNPDMTSFAEKPRVIKLDRKMGPYGVGQCDAKQPHIEAENFFAADGVTKQESADVYV